MRSCAWTRDGTYTTDILLQLAECPHLRELEINGHHTWNYDPDVLCNFHNLERLRVIMSSKEVVSVLPQVFQKNYNSFRSLSLICKVRMGQYIRVFLTVSSLVHLIHHRRISRASSPLPASAGAVPYRWISESHAAGHHRDSKSQHSGNRRLVFRRTLNLFCTSLTFACNTQLSSMLGHARIR